MASALSLLGGAAFGKNDLRSLIFGKLNDYRVKMNLPPLSREQALDDAAQMQTDYCQKQDSLLHIQAKSKQREFVSNRVALSHGSYDGLNELIFAYQPNAGRPAAEWAQQALDQILYYPELKQVALDPHQGYAGIGAFYDAKAKRIIVVQVFATSHWQPVSGIHLHKRAYGLRPADAKLCRKRGRKNGQSNAFIHGWTLSEKGNSPSHMRVDFQHNVYRLPKDYLTKPKGKVAADIVFRDQFPCDKANQLHGSPYHDGYMLRPRGWLYMALFHNRETEKAFQAMSVRSNTIPALNPDSLQINKIYSKKRRFCDYGIVFSIPSDTLGPFDYQFPPDTVAFGASQPYRSWRQSFKIPFQKNLTEPDEAALKPLLDSLKLPGVELLNMRIKGYASVEGTLEINQELYNRRAQVILERVQQLQAKPVRMSSSASENWSDFRRDIRNTTWKKLLRLSNDNLRDTLHRDKALLKALEPILSQHRYAQVELDLRIALDNTIGNAQLEDSLQSALAQQNFAAAQAVQSELWRRWESESYSSEEFLRTEFPRVPGCLPLIHNQYCMAERLARRELADTTEMLHGLSKTYPWFEARRVYALSLAARQPSFAAPFPNNTLRDIQNLKRRNPAMSLVRVLELHYYHGLNIYNTQRGKLEKKDLKQVYSRLVVDSLDAGLAYRLGLYYNRCRAMDETIKLLKPFMEPDRWTEDLVFLYAWTALHATDQVSEGEMVEWMVKAQAMNPARWQKKADQDWQLLRYPKLKALYCQCNPTADLKIEEE